MLGHVPPAWVPWLAMTWATCWSVWAAIDCWVAPRHAMTLRIAHLLHLAFCLQWSVFETLQLFGVWTRADYLDFVAPYAPVVFAAGPWAIWPIKHWFFRRTVRAEHVAMTTVSEGGSAE